MKVAFPNDGSFAFNFVRNLGLMYYGGSDLGEMIATAGLIKEGEEESWFTEWDKLTRQILSRADASLAAGHMQFSDRLVLGFEPWLIEDATMSNLG